MILEDIEQMLLQVSLRYSEGHKAFANGDEVKAVAELAALRDVLDDCLDRTTEEAPEQQQDDAKDNESPDEKSGVGDAPHVGHCVPS